VILGTGIDMVEVSRMERILEASWADRFLARVFSPEEVDVCLRNARPSQAFSARFAAKEALAKALGTGFSRGVSPSNIVVHGGERQRPAIELSGSALTEAKSMGVTRIHVSLSHTPITACAVVIVEASDCGHNNYRIT
jgi:holo-[acyl-carrier protein] synthase